MILHQFKNLRSAQAFSDYLTLLKIENNIKQDDFQYQIIINDLTQQQKAQAELVLFLENPNQAKYLSASWESDNTKTQNIKHVYEKSHLISNFIDHGGKLTHTVLVLCILVYALSNLGLFKQTIFALSFFSEYPFNFSQSWRFITPAFLHFSVLHIVFNLLWWWQLAGIVEKQQGKQHLLVLFLVSAIISNLAQYFLVGPYFGGLSGVVYALIGYCWLFGKLNKRSPVNLENAYFIFLLIWLILGFVDLLPVNVANYAHLFGLLSGLCIAIVVTKFQK